MESGKILCYDGSFNGFLTAVFTAYEERIKVDGFQKTQKGQNGLFAETHTITTQVEKARRVWNAIYAKNNSHLRNVYFAFLSEQDGVEFIIYRYLQLLFSGNTAGFDEHKGAYNRRISQYANAVSHEKHRMEAFVRFHLTQDGIYFANIAPEYDVLPLISKHFRARFSDQAWIIYDLKRKYGLYYEDGALELITLDLKSPVTNSSTKSSWFADGEAETQQLWRSYFESTCIRSRINPKLHQQHIPKRYWKYLSEKKAG